MCLIQYLVLISIQIVSQIAVCDNSNDEQVFKGQVKKIIHVENSKASKELKAIKKKSANYSFNS